MLETEEYRRQAIQQYIATCVDGTISELYGIELGEAAQHFNLLRKAQLARRDLPDGFSHAAADATPSPLERAVLEYDLRGAQLRSTAAVRRIIERPIDGEIVHRKMLHLLDAQYPLLQKSLGTLTEEERHQFVEHRERALDELQQATAELPSLMHYFREDAFEHLRQLYRDVRSMNPKVVPLYMHELRQHMLESFGSIDAAGTIMTYSPSVLEAMKRETRIDAFTALGAEDAALLSQFSRPSRHLDDVIALHAASADMPMATQLLGAVQEAQREELLRYLCRKPAAAGVFKTLQRAGMRRDEYLGFLFNAAEVPAWEATVFDAVAEVAKDTKQPANAQFLARYALDLVADERASRIKSVISAYRNAHIVLADYLDARRAGEQNKASIAFDLAELQPDDAELKRLRSKLAAIDDAELAWSHQGTAQERIQRLDRYKKTRPVPHAPRQKREPLPWQEAMFRILDGQLPNESVQTVKRAYDALPAELTRVIRNVWVQQPASLVPFCEHVAEFAQHDSYRQLLRNADMFASYCRELPTNGELTARLRRATSAPNPYQAVRAAIESRDRSLEERCGTASSRPLPPLKGYNRVIILGGSYQDEEEFVRGFGVPVRIYGKERLKSSDLGQFGAGDLVIYLTKRCDHTMGYRAKKYIGQADFKKTPFENVSRIVEDIRSRLSG